MTKLILYLNIIKDKILNIKVANPIIKDTNWKNKKYVNYKF